MVTVNGENRLEWSCLSSCWFAVCYLVGLTHARESIVLLGESKKTTCCYKLKERSEWLQKTFVEGAKDGKTKVIIMVATVECSSVCIDRNVLACMVSALYQRNPCTVWCQPQSKEWWEDIIRGKNNSWWKTNLRVSQNTFSIFRNELHPYIVREITQLRLPISVDQRVAVTIWKLATNVEYRTLSLPSSHVLF